MEKRSIFRGLMSTVLCRFLLSLRGTWGVLSVRGPCTYTMLRRSSLVADFLFTEPIVFLLAVYIAIAYATLYAFFAAYPIVFQHHRGFSEGQGGLMFLGIGIGNLLGLSFVPVQNRLYWRAMDRNDGRTIPEAYVYPTILSSHLFNFVRLVVHLGDCTCLWSAESSSRSASSGSHGEHPRPVRCDLV